MEVSVGEQSEETNQPCRKGRNRGKITALEAAYEGCQMKPGLHRTKTGLLGHVRLPIAGNTKEFRTRCLTALFAVLFIVSTCIFSTMAAAGSSYCSPLKPVSVQLPLLNDSAYRPGQIIIKFKTGLPAALKESIIQGAGASRILEYISQRNKDIQLVQLEPNATVENAIKALRSQRDVVYAEPNYIGHTAYSPADPDYYQQWGLDNYGQNIKGIPGTPDADIDAPEGWDIEKGESDDVIVAVTDSGIDSTHPDLDSKVLSTGYNWAGISQTDFNKEWPFGNGLGTQYLYQSIKGTGCTLDHIGVLIKKIGSPITNAKIGISNSIGGAYLATITLTPSEVGTAYSYIYKQLSATVNVTAGTTYYLAFQTNNNNASNYYELAYNDGGVSYDTYRDGLVYRYNGSGYSSYPDCDFFFATNPNDNPRDDNGHGTHVAGIIAAESNSSGGVGVAFGSKVKVLPLKVADSSGNVLVYDLSESIQYAADQGADVINISICFSSYSQAAQDAINYAYQKGAIVFASAGNTGDGSTLYPAGCQNVVSVSSTDNKDQWASSNHNLSVDVSAPGENIYSTLPTYPVSLTSQGHSQNYDYLSGTSMSCPIASGVAALVHSKNPLLTPLQIEQIIEQNTDDLGTAGRDDYYGYGRINAYKALFAPPTPIPHIANIVPSQGAAGTLVTINGSNFGVIGPFSVVTFNGVGATPLVWQDTIITTRVPDGATTGPVVVSTPGGNSNGVTFTVTGTPTPTHTWYLAEGTTAWGFSTYITIQNPNASAVNAKVTYMPKGSPNVTETLSLPAMSQTTLTNDHLSEKMGGQADFSTKVEATDKTKPIAVDRTMEWTGEGAPSLEGHSSVGVTSPDDTWYLPEGSTNWGFETWLLTQNPNGTKATCTVTYMIEGEAPQQFTKEVPANSRESFSMASDIGNKDASIKVTSDIPVIPERAMYRNNRREGHDSIGTTAPATDYFLAEGTTAWGFTTYVLVQNPNPDPCDVTITYMTPSGQQPQGSFNMSGNSRKTIRVNDVAGMGATDFSTRVHGSKPIIAERAMYWGEGTPSGEACHDSIGMAMSHKTFYLPDGQTSEGRETYTLIQNPNTTDVTVDISYLTPDGQGEVTKTETIPASSRRTFNMLEHSGITGRAAIMVTCTTSGRKIMVERAMYWNNRGAGTDTIGGYGD